MHRLFNPEGLLWKPLGYIGELVMLSLLWALCSVPVVTLGPASAALYDTTVHVLRRRDDSLFARFFSTFRRELKEGILSTLLCAAGLLALGLVYYLVLRVFPGFAERRALALLPAILLAFFALGFLCWVWPTLSRFTLGLGALHGTALRLALGHSLRSAAMALLWGAAAYFSFRFLSPILFLPGLAALLSSYLVEPVFAKYENS